MAVPKRKTSPGKTRSRRNQNQKSKYETVQVSEDKTTGTVKRPHHVAPDGYYNGRQVTTAKVHR
jgi:large subunit ribosomal protein L32